MIKIKTIKESFESNGEIVEFQRPERVLTEKENKTVTSMLSNGVEYIYYQGDEPKK